VEGVVRRRGRRCSKVLFWQYVKANTGAVHLTRMVGQGAFEQAGPGGITGEQNSTGEDVQHAWFGS
jgi:hypothetical protein